MKGSKTIFYANGKQRDVAIFISDIMGLKLKTVIRDKKGHCMIINGLIHQEDITNIPALNIGDPKYMKKKILIVLMGEVDKHTITVGEFNIPFSTIDRSSKRKSIRK